MTRQGDRTRGAGAHTAKAPALCVCPPEVVYRDLNEYFRLYSNADHTNRFFSCFLTHPVNTANHHRPFHQIALESIFPREIQQHDTGKNSQYPLPREKQQQNTQNNQKGTGNILSSDQYGTNYRMFAAPDNAVFSIFAEIIRGELNNKGGHCTDCQQDAQYGKRADQQKHSVKIQYYFHNFNLAKNWETSHYFYISSPNTGQCQSIYTKNPVISMDVPL